MTDLDPSLGLALHAALVAVSTRATALVAPETELALMRAVTTLARRIARRWPGLDPLDVEEVISDVGLTLLTRPLYEGSFPGQAIRFVSQLVQWRLADLAREQARLREVPVGEDDLAGAAAASIAEGDEPRWRLHRVRQTLLLLAGESRKYPRVRAFLDHRLGLVDHDAPGDRRRQLLLAQQRSVGRRYALSLVEEHPGSFAAEDAADLAALLGESLLSSPAPDPRLLPEDE